MKFALVICTYKRAEATRKLLGSVATQELYPDEVIVVDGSEDDETQIMLRSRTDKNVQYFKVAPRDRGLTRQRNYGISKVGSHIDVVCFLDDDVILEVAYFSNLLSTYRLYPEALGVGGYIIESQQGHYVGEGYQPGIDEYFYDGWVRPDGSRFIARKRLGLDSDLPPGFAPAFSHGRSVGFLPPSGKIYEVQQLMGGVSSFRRSVFERVQFSTYFEGYGLYEDADFTIRVSKLGKLFLNTSARLYHYHDSSGRPNSFRYGKMVVRNGWYVWRVGTPNPSFTARRKWYMITILLTLIRFSNTFTSTDRKEAFLEAFGRSAGLFSLIYNKPRIKS